MTVVLLNLELASSSVWSPIENLTEFEMVNLSTQRNFNKKGRNHISAKKKAQMVQFKWLVEPSNLQLPEQTMQNENTQCNHYCPS